MPTEEPTVYHDPVVGPTVPDVAAMVSWYWWMKLAVTVAGELGTVYVWVGDPVSLQESNTYCSPAPIERAETAEISWLVPGTQLKIWGVVMAFPSTRTYPEPAGLDVTVMLTAKFAVMVPGPLIYAVVDGSR
jgi:hypothetical protein